METNLLYPRHLLIRDVQQITVSVHPTGPALDMVEPGTIAHCNGQHRLKSGGDPSAHLAGSHPRLTRLTWALEELVQKLCKRAKVGQECCQFVEVEEGHSHIFGVPTHVHDLRRDMLVREQSELEWCKTNKSKKNKVAEQRDKTGRSFYSLLEKTQSTPLILMMISK